MSNITKRLVDSLKAQEKDFIVWDDAIKGFAIKVTPQGRKVYFLKYRNLDRKIRKPSIGVHGNSMTCEQARKMASEWSLRVRGGEDPSLDKKKVASSTLTVSDLCKRYMHDYAEVYKKPQSAYNDGQNIKNHIIPKLGKLTVEEISKQEIEALHLSLRKTPTLANHVRGIISKMLNLAEEWNLRLEGSNPVRFIKKYPSKSKERYLTSKEIDRLVTVLDTAQEQQTETPHVVALFKLLLLTGARLREIMDAQWKWVDFERKVLALPDSKTGKKNIRLSETAISVLRELPKIKGNPYVIIGNKEREQLKEPKKQWKRICKAANLEDVRIHDLRHTFASKCVENGIPLQVVGELLGHANIKTTERYAHLAEDQIRQATEHVGEKLAEIMG